jgi:hypothetical protein
MPASLNPLRLTAFYGLTLVLVLGLFKGITAHGETLLAPPNLGGQYRLQSPSLIGCSSLVLDLQQSGIYLNGAITPQSNPPDSQEVTPHPSRPTLTGHWHDSALTLTGRLDLTCLQSEIQLTAQPLSGDRLQGTFAVSGRSLPFLATRLAEAHKRSLH